MKPFKRDGLVIQYETTDLTWPRNNTSYLLSCVSLEAGVRSLTARDCLADVLYTRVGRSEGSAGLES